MIDPASLTELTAERRLALAYAPAAARADTAALFLLDARLAGIVRQTREPMLGQMRLAWWREQFSAALPSGVVGEPLLEQFALWPRRQGLAALVDGWEALLLADSLTDAAIDVFMRGRAEACRMLAMQLGEEASAHAAARAGAAWALAELGTRLSNPAEIERVRAIATESGWDRTKLPRNLRPIAILHGLARRKKGYGDFIDGPIDLLFAIRLGLIGR